MPLSFKMLMAQVDLELTLEACPTDQLLAVIMDKESKIHDTYGETVATRILLDRPDGPKTLPELLTVAKSVSHDTGELVARKMKPLLLHASVDELVQCLSVDCYFLMVAVREVLIVRKDVPTERLVEICHGVRDVMWQLVMRKEIRRSRPDLTFTQDYSMFDKLCDPEIRRKAMNHYWSSLADAMIKEDRVSH